MSGGFFEYKQYEFQHIADDIEQIVLDNDTDEYYGYSEETLKEFKKAVEILKKAQIYVQRIDWLVSGDDGEDTFHERLGKDLEGSV